jgi:hypothetical protein
MLEVTSDDLHPLVGFLESALEVDFGTGKNGWSMTEERKCLCFKIVNGVALRGNHEHRNRPGAPEHQPRAGNRNLPT